MIRRLLCLGALALVLGAAVRLSTTFVVLGAAAAPRARSNSDPGPGADTGDGRPRWREVWTRPAPGIVGMALAPRGAFVAWIDNRGAIRRLDARGRTDLQTPAAPGRNRVVVAPGGTVLAYAALNPVQPAVHVFGLKGAGSRPRTFPVEGAVWDAQIAPDGNSALIGTGQSLVYQLPLSPPPPASQPLARWRAPGIPGALTLGSGGSIALGGTWQQAGVSAWALPGGTPRWRHEGAREPDRIYQVCLSATGNTAVGVSARGPREAEARLDVWDAGSGARLWSQTLPSAFHPKALVSADGRLIAVTYVAITSYRSGELAEHRLALFDRTGRRLFKDKGGPFFAPTLVALSSDGARLTVRNDQGYLFTVDPRGRTISMMRLPVEGRTRVRPVIRDTIVTGDGAFLLLRRGDNKISLYQAAAS